MIELRGCAACSVLVWWDHDEALLVELAGEEYWPGCWMNCRSGEYSPLVYTREPLWAADPWRGSGRFVAKHPYGVGNRSSSSPPGEWPKIGRSSKFLPAGISSWDQMEA